MSITKLCAIAINYVRAAVKTSLLMTRAAKGGNLKADKMIYAFDKTAVNDIAYHGSPFKFSAFDCSKIGEGEGLSRHGIGIYFFKTKKCAPFYSNIRSKDAPIHIGATDPLDNPAPHIYTVSGFNSLKLKTVSSREARKISKNQFEFELSNPKIDGLEIDNGELCVFPKAVHKLKIKHRDELEDFVMMNRSYPFRQWTTDKKRLEKFI